MQEKRIRNDAISTLKSRSAKDAQNKFFSDLQPHGPLFWQGVRELLGPVAGLLSKQCTSFSHAQQLPSTNRSAAPHFSARKVKRRVLD